MCGVESAAGQHVDVVRTHRDLPSSAVVGSARGAKINEALASGVGSVSGGRA